MELHTGDNGSYPIAAYALSYDDGTGWKPIPGASATGNTRPAVATTFTQGVTARKVRFTCLEPASEYCRVKELWVFGSPHAVAATNVALNKPVVAATTHATYPAAQAVDGSLTTRWESEYMFMTHTHFDVDLRGHHELQGAELHLSINSTSSYAMENFELQAWNGGCWQTIPGSVVAGNPVSNTQKNLTFTAPVTTHRVRLVCKDKPTCRLRELKLMGVPSTVVPTGPTACAAGQQTVVRGPRYDYALFLPEHYNDDRTTRWPVIISMHGVGNVGTLKTDRTAVLASPEGLAKQFNNAAFRAAMQAIVISPNQRDPFTNAGDGWFNANRIMALLADAQRDYRVDPDRLYLTGLSGGANLSLELGVSNTAKLAAIVPIATTSNPANDPNVCNMKHLPIWAFHGGSDSPERSTNLKLELDSSACGADPSAMRPVTVYPGAGHSGATWDTAYATLALYDWLLQQRISARQ